MGQFLKLILLLGVIAGPIWSGELTYQPAVENQQMREWFQDSKFGLFIHWGPYSVLEKGEWVLEKSELSLHDYQALATSQFNPNQYDPAAWVAMAKNAGMKYITITSRHHDGFAMWGTKQNDWNVVDGSPCARDLIKPLAEECHRQGMKLFFYYSQLDWHHPDYFPLGKTGSTAGRTSEGDFDRYLDYVDAQLTELLTQYGEISGIWFDGMWDKPEANWRLGKTYDLIHQLQPAALIGSNHHFAPFAGEDFQMFEKDLPGQSTQDWEKTTFISTLPLETCETINESWGYNREDTHFKSTKELIHYLVKAAGNNANLLLNVGPCPDGSIQPEFIERLQAMGAWLNKNGGSIYGTRSGPIKPMHWGVSTQKGEQIFLHVLNQDSTQIAIPYSGEITRAEMWESGAEILVEKLGDGYVLHLEKEQLDPIDTIIILN